MIGKINTKWIIDAQNALKSVGFSPLVWRGSSDFAGAIEFTAMPMRKQNELKYGKETIYTPKRILKSGPCTIVFWQDGTKTMVRRAMDEETDSPYEAFTAALAIKIFGSNSAVKRTVKNKLVEQIKKPKNNA